MNINPSIYKEMKNNNNIITTSRVIELGFSKTLLTKYIKNGLLIRIGHGIYTFSNEVVDDMYILSLRSNKIIFSHDTALFLNGLSDRTPFKHSITIPSNFTISSSMAENCICYYIKPEYYLLGVIEKETTFGNIVRCYNAERTICDILRSRNRIDDETVLNAIKKYAISKNKDLNLLSDYAKKLNVNKLLKKYLEVLL